MSINLDYANDLDRYEKAANGLCLHLYGGVDHLSEGDFRVYSFLRAIDAGICIAVMKAVYKVIWRYVRTELCH